MKSAISVVICTLLFLSVNTVKAMENGLQAHAVGVNTQLNGILPLPGQTYFYNYSLYYHADRTNDSKGHSAVPGFSVDTVVDAPRIVHTWEQKLGPFSLATGALVPIIHTEVSVYGHSDTDFNLGDATLHPLLFGYVSDDQTLHTFVAPFDMALPTGHYDKDNIANTGQGRWSFVPNWQLTWFPTRKIEVSTSVVAEMSRKNKDTDYQSGSAIHFEGLLGYSLNEKWQVGVQGFYSKQFTDDKVDGEKFLDGYKLKGAAVGPQVRYNFTPASGIVLKYQKEFIAENKAEGGKLWVTLAFPL